MNTSSPELVNVPARLPAKNVGEDEIALNELIRILWQGKWFIAAITFVFMALALVASLTMQKKYQASAVISPVSEDSTGMGGLGSLISQYGGLASLAGIPLGGNSKKSESIAALQSEILTERYIEQHGLLKILYADKWDEKSGQWKVKDPAKVPTLWQANQFFKKKVRSITEESKTGMVTLTVVWKDPRLAAEWANGLVKMTNDHMRDRTLRESERNIAYLNDQAAKTNNVEVQRAIYSILETEIKKVMLSRGTEEYAFRVIDPAIAPEKPSSPQPLIWTIGGFIVGFLISAMIVLARKMTGSARTAS